uniref:Methyltransferase n=1 Tax=Ananas comosus var. bracteatus TaxID=296719 RepID=A0A6V7NLT9_ANACO|nr:unnamed protein product [Ananas comosus var. bracteatus]
MAGLRLGRSGAKRGPLGFVAKVSLAVVLGLSFVVIWSTFSPSTSSADVSTKRSSFGDISDPEVEPPGKKKETKKSSNAHAIEGEKGGGVEEREEEKSGEKEEGEVEEKEEAVAPKNETLAPEIKEEVGGEEKAEAEGLEEVKDGEDEDTEDGIDVNSEEDAADGENRKKGKNNSKNKKKLGPLFDPGAHYHWKQCGGKSGHNYIPCVDYEGIGGQRHHERSCPRSPFMCLVSLPKDYKPPLPWPEREFKIWYSNVGHPRLSAYIKTQNWLNHLGEYLLFPRDESEFKGGAHNYVDSVEEMVPDIEWGKNIRVVLDIGCVSASFGAILLEKGVITLSLGLMNDQTDLAQVALERGILAIVSNLGLRRLPFPSGVFDAIHCGECNIQWHSNGGRLLLELNRILRPGGYFIISSKHGDVDSEEGMSNLMSAICWNVLAHKTDDVSEVGIRVYQRPASNDIYELRRRREPRFCKEDENQDASWYTPIRTCLHKVPAAIEERGSDWPEEWPKRLETFPDWLGDLQERLTSDHDHWKAIIDKSYLNGMGIDWSNIRNVMDMKAIYGGFAAALASQKVWVMNVVPVHAPNTLPIIFERGSLVSIMIGVNHLARIQGPMIFCMLIIFFHVLKTDVNNLLLSWLRWTAF